MGESTQEPAAATDRPRANGRRSGAPGLERVVLAPRADAEPSAKAPVRIFLGTEPAQYRAERVFFGSIEQVRDPGRAYEIYLMKNLPGFWTWLWTTGFTNYRFAVPHFAGARGRAIYNDVDQVYLADPGELFDLDLEGHGYLAVSETDTSVMLLDCERMARVWTIEGARRRRKYGLIRRALAEEQCGPLGPEWNARDAEYAEGRSKLLHFTTLHRQPWRPFPEACVYQSNPHAEVWFDLERRSNETGFHVFGPERPSAECGSTRRTATRAAAPAARRSTLLDGAVSDLVERTGARSVLETAADAGNAPDTEPQTGALPGRWGAECRRRGALVETPEGGNAGERAVHDGVVCLSGLEDLPPADAPWIIDRLFARADRFVFAAVRCPRRRPRRRRWKPFHGTVGQPEWWTWLFESAAARRPAVSWELAITRGRDFEPHRVEFRRGGRFAGRESPRVWVLADHKPGHTTQSVGLAEELGWPYQTIDLDFGWLAELPNVLVGASRLGLKRTSARRLAPPWPDLVIATGRRTAPVARWIRKRSAARTRTAQMGRMGAFLDDDFDLGVAPLHARLHPDPRRIDLAAPITRVSESALEEAAQRWRERLIGSRAAQTPRIALLVGGRDPSHELTPEVARRMGEDIAEMAKRCDGEVWVTTSRRTAPAAAEALEQGLGPVVTRFHRWEPGQIPRDNPYMAYLALADALVVTGESASMLAEACALGKPVYIYPLPEITRGLRGLVRRALHAGSDLVTRRAYAQPVSRRGIERPQRGLEYLCARLVSGGWVRPRSDPRLLHDVLVERGFARYLGGTFGEAPPGQLSEVGRVADRVRALLGVPIDG